MSAAALNELIRNDVFINAILGLAAILIVSRFLTFVIEVWRDGLLAHFVPCKECSRRLAPTAWFCPHCGHFCRAEWDAAGRLNYLDSNQDVVSNQEESEATACTHANDHGDVEVAM